MRPSSLLPVIGYARVSTLEQGDSGLLDQARREGWGLVVVDLGADTMTPPGELVADVTASTSQYERRMIGQRTRGRPWPPRGPRGCGSAARPRCRTRWLRGSGSCAAGA
ncbi:MAG: recombinase family protein [Candidatus Dormibacteria bacterium]